MLEGLRKKQRECADKSCAMYRTQLHFQRVQLIFAFSGMQVSKFVELDSVY